MAQNQQQGGAMPSSQGGLVQYFDADTGFEIDPKTVIMAGGLIAVLEIVLQTGILPV
ncbi:MAG: preprotein translocase subunit Sec61beta [Candidatus Nanosalina sp.]